jgi:hypothetical protein
MLSESLSHVEWVRPGIEPTTTEVTGTDINFEHRSYHCATLTTQSECGQQIDAGGHNIPSSDKSIRLPTSRHACNSEDNYGVCRASTCL